MFGALFALQYFPGYGYAVLAAVVASAMTLGALGAYSLPYPFIMLLRFIAADPGAVVLWGKRKGGRRHET